MGIIRLISKKEFVIVLLNTSDERITLETSAISECYDLDIKEFLKENELDCLLIEPEGIILLKKNSNKSYLPYPCKKKQSLAN